MRVKFMWMLRGMFVGKIQGLGYHDIYWQMMPLQNRTTDGSGNLISLSLSDLIKALTFANKTDKPENVLAPPVFSPATNVLPVTVSGGSLSSETEKRIAQQVSKNIKDEMLVQRSTTPVIPAPGECPSDGCNDSAACSQGSQFSCNSSSAAPFDGGDYIRKDSIPCWGCKLPQ